MERLLSLRLRSLQWLSPDTCRGSFESSTGECYETNFTVSRGGGITTATDDEGLIGRIEGSAGCIRSIVHAVVSFCDAAQQSESL